MDECSERREGDDGPIVAMADLAGGKGK